ncbi:hypothetical protein [Moraxella equi]|uniref:hypothetical protein n=1 Tax=Moraxella equi TaxID=60442 RepID=UPI00142E0C44|nr:hypothetical protein [Moraxella equi]
MSSIDKLTNKELKALFDMPPERAIEHLKIQRLTHRLGLARHARPCSRTKFHSSQNDRS